MNRRIEGQELPLAPYDFATEDKGWTVRGDKVVRRGLKKEIVVKFAQTMMNTPRRAMTSC